MRSIMVLNSKGGSGKSTVATNLASYYATQGKRVVLVDLDPQSSSSRHAPAGVPPSAVSTVLPGTTGYHAAPTW